MLLRRYHPVSSQPIEKVEKPIEKKAETKKPVARKRVVKNG